MSWKYISQINKTFKVGARYKLRDDYPTQIVGGNDSIHIIFEGRDSYWNEEKAVLFDGQPRKFISVSVDIMSARNTTPKKPIHDCRVDGIADGAWYYHPEDFEEVC